ncbi:MAG TPA: HD-GYP domain-containing protein [Thermoclostridium sp.]|nr:HD-GYP domain-containing protein [Thermoclostridium sp.]
MAKKIKLNIKDCMPRMVVAETVYNDFGAVMVWQNTILNELTISQLDNLGVDYLYIYEQEINEMMYGEADELRIPGESHDITFQRSYEKDKDNIKELLHDISTGKTENVDDVIRIADSVYFKKDQNMDIINCITQIRNVDEYTYYHCINVSMISMLIGKWLKLGSDDIHMLVQAGLLHDIGKSVIPDSIIEKPGKLTVKEYESVKKHSQYGYYLAKKSNRFNDKITEAILYHHEREDGSGYPQGLHGDMIPLFAKIIAVADTYDAMTANKTYKSNQSPFEVFAMMQNSCFGYLDPVVLNTFLSNISHYYVGIKVKLNDGRIAEVVYINYMQYGKPVLKVGDEYIDLMVSRNIKIDEVI